MSRANRWATGLCVAAALLCVPALFSLDYYLHIFVMAGIHAMLAISLGLIIGFSGQVSLCHAAFYGIGAYGSALASLTLGLPFWLAMWVGGLLAGIFSYALGRLVLRLKGHFLAITTAFFGVLVTVVLNNWVPVTKGPMGIPGIPRPGLPTFLGPWAAFESRVAYYYLVLVFIVGVTYLVHRVAGSRLGRALTAIRENEDAVRTARVVVPPEDAAVHVRRGGHDQFDAIGRLRPRVSGRTAGGRERNKGGAEPEECRSEHPVQSSASQFPPRGSGRDD